mgnify:CR=1 FL=1
MTIISLDKARAKKGMPVGWHKDLSSPDLIDPHEIKKLIRKGGAESHHKLGEIYELGLVVQPNTLTAQSWYKKAAVRGYAPSQNSLGNLFADDGNFTEALTWLNKAANQGSAEAMYNLALLYSEAEGSVEEDLELALNWYSKSAALGFVPAQNNLGVLFDHGRGVQANLREAIMWYTMAADQGSSDAMYNLGVVLTPMNPGAAVHWYDKAAAQGNPSAQYNLGVLFQKGKGVPRCAKRAMGLFEKAALQGIAYAQFNLGVLLEERNKTNDKASAASWYKQAADQGLVLAQVNLGVMLACGVGVSLDLVDAYHWFLRANASGDAEAALNLDAMRFQMTVDQISQAQNLAAKHLKQYGSTTGTG